MSFARNFALGQQIGKGLVETYQTAKQQKEFEEIQKATPQYSEGYTAQDGEQLRAMANARDPDGNPYYKLDTTPEGGYNVRNNFEYAGPDGQTVRSGGSVGLQPRRVADFLGQRYEGDLTPERIEGLRARAMASAVAKTDPIRGMGLMQQVKAGERDDIRAGQETWRFGREQTRAGREDADNADKDAVKDGIKQWWDKRLAGPDGQTRAPTMDDYMAASQFRAAALFKAGKHEEAVAASQQYLQGAAAQIQLQTAQRDEALGRAAAAASSGDFNAVKDFYNQFIPDGARVTDVRRNKDGTIQITRETIDGSALPPTVLKDMGEVMSALSTFKDPMALYRYTQQQFLNDLKVREVAATEKVAGAKVTEAEATAGLRRAQAGGIRDATANRAAAAKVMEEFDSLTPDEQMGPRGQGLIQRFNTLNVKNGATVPLGAKGGGGAAGLRYQTDNLWADTEKTLRGNNTPLDQIQAQRNQFYAMRGFAPESELNVLFSGRDEKGTKLTREYVESFKRQYPNTPIDESQLKWLNKAGPKEPEKTGGLNTSGYTPPPGSPAAKAAENRKRQADETAKAEGVRRDNLARATEESNKTMGSIPRERFEEDRKSMSKAELRRRYGNGAGLTDEQFAFMMK
jgi:hypothetical protein